MATVANPARLPNTLAITELVTLSNVPDSSHPAWNPIRDLSCRNRCSSIVIIYIKKLWERRYLELRELGISLRRTSDFNLGRIGEVEIIEMVEGFG